jgi:hypothetical protein
MVDDGEIGTVKHAIEMMDTKYLLARSGNLPEVTLDDVCTKVQAMPRPIYSTRNVKQYLLFTHRNWKFTPNM